MAYDYSRIPPELWDLVMENLPRKDLRSCLSASRLFHDLALPRVFSHLKIHINLLETQRDDMQSSEAGGDAGNTLAVLDRIACDARFARIVKNISVCATGRDSGWAEMNDVSGWINALQALPHLQAFRWYGYGPTYTILDVLARTCGSTLSELSFGIPLFTLEDDSSTAMQRLIAPLRALPSRVLSIAGETRQFPLSPNHTFPKPQSIGWLQNIPHTLHRLSLWEDAIWDTPLPVFFGLHELSLQDPRSLERLGVVFESCTQLRSLNILTTRPKSEAQIIHALEAFPDALPHLTSFKLICGGHSFMTRFEPVAAFFRNKKHMRRLDLLTGDPFDEDTDDYTRYLDIFAGLPRLEVVGLWLGGWRFTAEQLRLLDERLPLGITALLVHWNIRQPRAPGAALPSGWTSVLVRRPALGYFHVLDYGGSLDLGLALLKDRPRSLELVGYGARLRWIERDTDVPARYGPEWSTETFDFRAAEDFDGREDWEWLLRGHDWEGPGALSFYG